MKIPEIYFKSTLVFERFDECSPILKSICFDMYEFCIKYSYRFFITETKTTEDEDKKLNRKSMTHREGRAFDMSCKNWSTEMISHFIAYFSHKYQGFGAIGSNGERLILHHDSGNGIHFHVQIKPGLSVTKQSIV